MGYLHSFSSKEQERLVLQARFLEESVYSHVDFSAQSRILEVGCGVGAQTEILLERFPRLFVQGVDAESKQIAQAKKRLGSEVKAKRAAFEVADAAHLPFEENAFDGAFICWFLEHVQDPVKVLREIRRTLKPASVIYCNEVLNASFYCHPYSPATLQYLFAFNDYQWNLKGDPFIGGKLANILLNAGYQNISTEAKVHHYDSRTPKKRAAYVDYWESLILSSAPNLIRAGKIDEALVKTMKQELRVLKEASDSVFFDSWIQARAQAF